MALHLPTARRRPKRTDRPAADIIQGARVELPLGPDLAAEIAMLWDVLGAIGHRRFAAGYADHEAMLADTRKIADRVRKRAARSDFGPVLVASMARAVGTDNIADQHAADIVALVRRDPRYLASDLVAGTVLLCRLLVVRGVRYVRRHEVQSALLAERARKYLDEIGDAARAAVATVTGRGRQEYIDPVVLLADYEHHLDVVGEVAALIDRGNSDDSIASEIGLRAATVGDIRERPRALHEHATQLTIELYGSHFTARQFGRHLRAARAAVADIHEPGEREVDALGREHPAKATKIKRRAK